MKLYKIFIIILSLVVAGESYQLLHTVKKVKASKNLHCYMFTTHADAQKAYDTKQEGYKTLYADKHGVVCKNLIKQIINP